jgi:hypothetical protein
METIVLILMITFLGLSAVLYIAGIFIVDRANLSMQLDHKIQQYYNWIDQQGSQEQKQAALVAAKNRDLENLQALVGMS